MQKPKDSDIDLIANFAQMAGRYLEGGVDNPKFGNGGDQQGSIVVKGDETVIKKMVDVWCEQ